MKLIVVLLAVGLSASEKLNRGYLPPPEAKHAGGSSEDLQTPLEYPKKNPIFGSENNGYSTSGNTNIGIIAQGDISSTTTENYMDTQNTAYPINSFVTGTPFNSEMEFDNVHTQNPSPGLRYPMKGNSIQQQEVLDSFRTGGYHYGQPGNMPIIAITEGIIDNYNPKAFGMYGGSPMIIKSNSPQIKLYNMIVDHNGNNLNHPSSGRSSGESYGPVTQKPDFFLTLLTTNFSDETNTYQPTTASPVESVISSNSNQRNQAYKSFQSRSKRPQADSERNAVILNYENVFAPDKYSYSFDTSNGVHMDESATIVNGVKALGSYSYTGDDGKVYSVVYSADENGFQPRGDHLPTPPPIPETIQKVIEQANRAKEAGIVHDGSYDEEKYGHMKYQGPVNRYLQKMQGNLQLKNRNRVSVPKQIYREPELVKGVTTNNYKVNGKYVKPLENVFQNSGINLSGQFATRKVPSADETAVNPIKNLNEENIENANRPMTYLEQHDNLNLNHRPSVTNYDKQRINTVKNKLTQSPSFTLNKVASKFDLTDNMPATKPKLYQAGMDKTMNLYKMTTYEDAGYYYVPPRRVFVEGRYQDKLPKLKEFQNKLSTIDQRDYNGKKYENPFETTSYFPITEEPNQNQQPYNDDLYGSNIQDDNQPIHNLRIATTPLSNGITVTITTPKPYSNTLSTNYYDTENTKDIDYQEETVFPEQIYDKGLPFTRNGEYTTNLSTTQMPSELKYTSSLSDSNLYDTSYPRRFDTTSNRTIYSKNEGYFRTTPELPLIFEDFPSSTNKPTFTDVGTQTEPFPDIKVDGFGRPIQDTNAPNNGYFTTEIPLNEAKPNPTTTYYNYEDISTFPKDNELVLGISDNLGLEQEIAKIGVDFELTGTIMGEDFSGGPKQPQRYDPETGYFY